ncbi:hypothetical protein GR199_32740 [Rhizobium leguminosarum]|nr:hypothetical protein [Rhizobium leguminosarum]
MRTQRPNFIVEYKTNRRQNRARPTLIWGNLDLQAAARAVESDGTMPEADVPQAPLILEDNAWLEPEVVTSDAHADTGGLSTVSSSPNKTIEPVGVDDSAFEKSLSSQERPTSASVRSRPRAKTRRLDIADGPTGLDHRLGPSMLCDSDEELAALDAENRHLKRLLVVKLREENDRLESMLRRFVGP